MIVARSFENMLTFYWILLHGVLLILCKVVCCEYESVISDSMSLSKTSYRLSPCQPSTLYFLTDLSGLEEICLIVVEVHNIDKNISTVDLDHPNQVRWVAG